VGGAGYFLAVRVVNRAPSRLIVRWLGGATIVGWAVVPFGIGVAHAQGASASPVFKAAIWAVNLAMFAALAVAVYLRHREVPRIEWIYAAVVAVGLVLMAVSPRSPGVVLSYIAVGVVTANVSARWGAWLMGAAIAGLLVIGLLQWQLDPLGLVGYVGVFFAAMTARERDALRASEARNDVLAERSYLAREIHDILAHSLSAQIVHLEAARLLLDRDREADRDQIRERVDRAQRLARSGLEETRRALATLRGEAPAPDEALTALAEEFRAATGRPCDVEIIGPSRDLAAQAGLAVVRTAQEALTNVRRHAPGARAVVRLRHLAEAVELEVTDSGGTAPADGMGGSGYGLVGMRERAELMGGTLEAGPVKHGFRVFLRVPA
jgi:signal transduction histidine kinase